MKRTLGILAGLGVLSLAGYFGGRLFAQAPPGQPTNPIQRTNAVQPGQPTTGMAPGAPNLRTRIAVINIAEVLKGYKKAKAIQDQMTIEFKNIDAQLTPLKTALLAKRNDAQRVPDQAQREQLERELRKMQIEIQEKDEDARKRMNKMSGDYMVQLYREIEESVRYYARLTDLDMVLFYFDPTDPANPNDPLTIQAKLRAGGALPMYIAPNLDVTQQVVGMMNQRLAPATATGGQP